MSAAENIQWQTVCDAKALSPSIGVRALLGGEQVAIFKVQGTCYAISAIDPFTQAAVLARGIVGDVAGKVVVASPIYKQHFVLGTGECIEDENVRVATYPVREVNGQIELGLREQAVA